MVVIQAFVEAKRSPQELAAFIEQCHKRSWEYLHLDAIEFASKTVGGVPGAMQNMRRLVLGIAIPLSRNVKPDIFTKLLSTMPGLQELKLRFWYSSGGKDSCSQLVSQMLANASIHRFRVLELSRGTCKSEALLDFLEHQSESLIEVHLDHFVLRGMDYDRDVRPMFAVPSSKLGKTSFWRIGGEAGILRVDDHPLETADVCAHHQSGTYGRKCSLCRSSCFQTWDSARLGAHTAERLAAMSIHGWVRENE
ncbi:hypothetical protein LTR85_001757 [Meristemomyces frigidus]|nr:hypothetical protein LTR85_001757 [Meristemomyces frigidus]